MIKNIKRNNLICYGLALACLFFLYSLNFWLLWLPGFQSAHQVIFNWPDANANYYFTTLFSTNWHLSIFEPLNLLTDNILHSRSINVVDGRLVPMNFLPGLFIFGVVAMILGKLIFLLFTPALSLLGVYIFFRLIKNITRNDYIARWAAIFLATNAAYIYFGNEAALTTILFIFLIILSLFLLSQDFYRHNIMGAWLFLLGVLIRPSDWLWLLILAGAIFWAKKGKLQPKLLLAIAGGALFLVGVNLWANQLVYGSWYLSGYNNLQTGQAPSEWRAAGLLALIFPFGVNIVEIMRNAYHFLWRWFWPEWIMVLIFFVNLVKTKNKFWLKYFVVSVLVSTIILFYYGSWDFIDPMASLNTISSSYVRYFLPLILIWLPFMAHGLWLLKTKSRRLAAMLATLIIIGNIILVLGIEPDGIFATQKTLRGYYRQFILAEKYLPNDAIIYSERADKIFFPKYRVIVPQGDLALWPRIKTLIIDGQSVYYYSNPYDATPMDSDALAAEGLGVLKVADLDNNGLYKVIIK